MSKIQERRDPARIPMAQPEVETSIDLMELLMRMLASWKLIICLALVGAIGMGVYVERTVKPVYKATSVIYVVSRSNSVVNMSDLQLGSALTNDFVKLFSMWELHEQVIEKLGLPYSYSTARSMLSVSNAGSTRMIDLTITSESAQEAADMANAYAEVASEFIAERMMTDKPTIMSQALVPNAPVPTNKTRSIMLGALGGAALAMGYVALRMLLDDKFKTAEEIRRYTGLTTLAVIPIDENNKGEKRSSKKKSRGKEGGRA